MQTPPETSATVSKRSSLWPDNNNASPLYKTLELVRKTTSVRKEAENNLNIAQKRYKLHHDRHVRFAHIFRVGHEVYPDRPSLLCSVAEKSPAEGYNPLLQRRREAFKVVCMSNNTLLILKNFLKNSESIHQATLIRKFNALLQNSSWRVMHGPN